MSSRRRASSQGSAHRFGGDWTTAKLDVVANYLSAYTTALKHQPSKEQPFVKAYIDAFAGTGYRVPSNKPDEAAGQLLFPDLADAAPQGLLEGSAVRALKTEPRFDHYLFIERSEDRCRQLEQLKQQYPSLAGSIRVFNGEANQEIRTLCSKDWSWRRAVLFLDPYGMQVEWETLRAIAATQAIDLWLLFPLGIGVNRLLTRSGDIPVAWRRRLDLLLGTEDWFDAFYKVEAEPTLFGGAEEHVVKASLETIGRYFNERLASIFAAVAEPGVLRNSSGSPLFLLCFAASNKRGARTALKIASHLLAELR
jgi:three-Cys-motif partner protein